MTSTVDRRLAKVEAALSPTEVVLAWLADAQQFASIEDQARAIAHLPVEAAPLSLIGQRIESSVRAASKGQPAQLVGAALRRALGDGAFLFCLVLQINGQTVEMAEVEGLRAAAVFYWMGCLLSGPRADDLHPAARDDHRTELAVCWANWREVVERLSRDVEIENAARAQLQRRYFGGREVFFADTGQAWAEHVDLVDRLERLAQGLTPPAKPSSRRCSPRTDGIASLEDRIAQRVEVLADDARVRAFGIMGERDRAVGIMERRLVAD